MLSSKLGLRTLSICFCKFPSLICSMLSRRQFISSSQQQTYENVKTSHILNQQLKSIDVWQGQGKTRMHAHALVIFLIFCSETDLALYVVSIFQCGVCDSLHCHYNLIAQYIFAYSVFCLFVCLLFYRNAAAFALFSGFHYIRIYFLFFNNIETKTKIVSVENIFRRNSALRYLYLKAFMVFKNIYCTENICSI